MIRDFQITASEMLAPSIALAIFCWKYFVIKLQYLRILCEFEIMRYKNINVSL